MNWFSVMVPSESIRISTIAEPQLDLLLPKGTLDVPLWKSLFAGIDAALFPKKLPPLVLTSKPVAAGELWGEHLTRPWWHSVFENLRRCILSQEAAAAATDLETRRGTERAR